MLSAAPHRDCPTKDALAAYCVGKLPSAQLDWLASHLAVCAECQSSLDELQRGSSDSLVDILRRCVAQAPPMESTKDDAGRTATLVPGKSSSSVSKRLAAGSSFGHFELLEEIGHGGMGVVFRARQTRLNRIVALKMIRTGSDADAEERERFCIEGQAIARLHHPNVMQVHEFNEHAGQFYLCMEFLAGGTLAGKLGGKGLPLREAALAVRDLAGAIQAAHDQHIVHRDLKPANVLLATDGTPKISDFGLAKLLDADDCLTQTGDVLGTPSYMAPEQAQGRISEIGERTDIYALGAILYECLTGKPPFKGATKKETLELVAKQPVVPPRRLRPDVPPDLEDICLKCLEKSPDQRPASAAELATDLQNWLDGKSTRLRPRRGWRRLWYGVRRRPRTAVAILLVAIAAPAFGYYFHPNRPLWRIQDRLNRGEEVELIGATGMPAWWRPLMGESTASLEEDGTFAIHGWPMAMIELLPDTRGLSRFRIFAETRHLKGGDNSAIGLFFAKTKHGGTKVPVYSFLELTYDDRNDKLDQYMRMSEQNRKLIPVPTGNRVTMTSRYCADVPEKHLQTIYGRDFLNPQMFRASGNAGIPGKWRQIMVAVSPSKIVINWCDKSVGEIDPSRIRQADAVRLEKWIQANTNHPATQGLTPELNLQGGIGLYLRESDAEFRNMRLVPQID